MSSMHTSVTDPLQIDQVVAGPTPGVIGMTMCPGRHGLSLAVGSWDRDLAMDLEVVRGWLPDIAISLLEDCEYPLLAVPEFKTAVAAAELPWVYAPIRDGGIPHEAFARTWGDLGPRVRNILRQGGRVLIHCRAGLGRTGLLAASLMTELGATPLDAINLVRAARDGAIETHAQEEFVREQRPVRPPPARTSGVAGTMFGAAIGDALGSAFEFLPSSTIEASLGEPFAWHYLPSQPESLLRGHAAGEPTDDTAMALSVAHVIARGALSAAAFAEAFVRDLDRSKGRFAAMFWNGGPGVATTGALSRLAAGASPASCGQLQDGGNGAAMRAHPVGLLRDRDEVLHVAKVQAKITHGHPAAVEAARAVAVLVHDALAGLEPTLDPPPGINERQFVGAWHEAHRDLTRGPERLPRHLTDVAMSGWCTVAAAHAISYVYRDDPRRAIAAAAASGEDTDTVACIVGGIVGARHGIEALGGEWMAGLTAREALAAAVDRLTGEA